MGPGTQARVTFRFYAELNDFLPPPRRQVAFEHVLEGPASVKDTIEALGVPHTELDLILANGESVDFSYRPADGDRIAAYPVFEPLDITHCCGCAPSRCAACGRVYWKGGHCERLAVLVEEVLGSGRA